MSESNDYSLPKLKELGTWSVGYSYLYLTALVAVIFGAGYLVYEAVGGLSIDANVSLAMHVNLGWVVEALVGFLLLVFVVWTTVQIVRVAGADFVNALIDHVASIADSYEK